MECIVCLDKHQTGLTCCDPTCTLWICQSCFGDYLSIIEKDIKLPQCLGKGCCGIYTYTSVKQISLNFLDRYIELCCKCITENNIGVNTEITNDKILKTMITDKLKFLQEKFPKSIYIIATNIYKAKLNKVNKKLLERKLVNTGKMCLNLFCSGILSENFLCQLCQTQFCNKCEQVKESIHTCNPEMIESITTVRSYKKCPKCKLPVDKDNGCDQVKCGICGTHFLYGTGELGGGGGHTVKVDVLTKKLLSKEYHDKLNADMICVINEIEMKSPKLISESWVNTTIKHLINDRNNKELKILLVKKIQKYHENIFIRKRYYWFLRELEKLIQSNKCTLDQLNIINNKI